MQCPVMTASIGRPVHLIVSTGGFMTTKTIKFSGVLSAQLFAPGSKSEHEALCVTLSSGKSYRVRRLGASDPFEKDTKWSQWVGQSVKGSGELAGGGSTIITNNLVLAPPVQVKKAKI